MTSLLEFWTERVRLDFVWQGRADVLPALRQPLPDAYPPGFGHRQFLHR
jgi:hypothetical protein